MLPRNQRQEALCRAYVRAIAAQAGVICGDIVQDFGIDMFLRGVEHQEQAYRDTGPQIDLQLKSTTRAEVKEPEVVYDLEVRAYNLLRLPVRERPRLLVLLVLPEDETQWLSQSVEELILRRCAYWVTLQGAELTTNQTTVRIRIPTTNAFSVEAVQAMLRALSEGKTL
jgi:hypothetical protein